MSRVDYVTGSKFLALAWVLSPNNSGFLARGH